MSATPCEFLFGDADPHAVAVECGAVRLTRMELAERAVAFAATLRAAGLAVDDHAALLCRNRVEVFEVVLGALLAGVWLTPVNWHLTPQEIAYILADSGARLVVVDDAHRELVPTSARALVLGDAYEAELAAARAFELHPEAPPGGTMMYTSGTSGQPKGVKRQRGASLAATLDTYRATARLVGFLEPGVHLVPGPLYHAAPLLFAVYDAVAGSTVLVMERWDTEHCLALLGERDVRHVHLVPTMIVRLLRLLDERRQAAPAGLRVLLHGAAPIAPTVKHEAIARFGPVLTEYWGATEGGVYTLLDSPAWLAHPGSVGRPLPSFEVYAVDDTGARLDANQRGTLVCRHRLLPQPFVYHHDPEKTRAAYVADGVFSVGDLGHVDEDSYVYLSDRRSNLILSGGVNIYPAEVEAALAAHPGVADVVVTGMADVEWGERVVAVVEAAEGTSVETLEAELRALCETRLARFKQPSEYRFVAQMPRLPSGKVRNPDLLALLGEPR
ncbi:MAG: AMP-binding protein [Myxococcales bacterium]|nr:AMP-binding protein [Myxococcales bacterium]MCB9625983.1 AMP-binding protein [Sandaracinaceae bacterium]